MWSSATLDYAACGSTAAVHAEQRRAALGMIVRHSGQARVFDSPGLAERVRACSRLYGTTKKKYTPAAMSTNAITAVRNEPYLILLPLRVSTSASKFGLPKGMAMTGLMISSTSAVTTAPNAPPTTNATAS